MKAAAFLASQWIGGQTLIERVMSQAIQLEQPMWRRLNMVWVVTFAGLGAINLYVVYHFSEEIWVNFKLFGMTSLTLLVAVAQTVWIVLRTASGAPTSEE